MAAHNRHLDTLQSCGENLTLDTHGGSGDLVPLRAALDARGDEGHRTLRVMSSNQRIIGNVRRPRPPPIADLRESRASGFESVTA